MAVLLIFFGRMMAEMFDVDVTTKLNPVIRRFRHQMFFGLSTKSIVRAKLNAPKKL